MECQVHPAASEDPAAISPMVIAALHGSIPNKKGPPFGEPFSLDLWCGTRSRIASYWLVFYKDSYGFLRGYLKKYPLTRHDFIASMNSAD